MSQHSRMVGAPASPVSARLAPWGLLALGLVPAVAGIHRLLQLAQGEVPAGDERFFAAPWPVVLHIVGSLVFAAAGAFQLARGQGRGDPRSGAHRVRGWIALPCGLLAALTGLWMTQFYPLVGYDGPTLWAVRWLVGVAMVLSLALGLRAIRRGDVAAHRAWMRRGYALGLGAGTQVFTHIPWFVWPELRSELMRTALMAAGWGINLVVAEWLTARERAGVARHSR